jgi:hypothetical protein
LKRSRRQGRKRSCKEAANPRKKGNTRKKGLSPEALEKFVTFVKYAADVACAIEPIEKLIEVLRHAL